MQGPNSNYILHEDKSVSDDKESDKIVNVINKSLDSFGDMHLQRHSSGFRASMNEINPIDEDHPSVIKLVMNLVISSLPATFGLLFVFVTETINIMVIGRLNNSTLIAAIGLGTLFVNATGYIPGAGLLGGIDTLCSQAYGMKNYKMVGNFTSIGRLSCILFFVLISVPSNFLSYYIMILIGVEHEISIEASHFCHAMSISVFFALQFNTSLRYLQSMNIFFPGAVITLITASIHPFWSTTLVYKYELGVIGAALALGITQFLNFLFVSIYIHISNPCPESYFYFSHQSLKIRNIWRYLVKAIPAAILFSADWIGFEILTFMSSFLGSDQLAANVCQFNFISVIFMIHLGLSIATTTLVGNSIGAEHKKKVMEYAYSSLGLGIVLMIISTSLVIFFRSYIPGMYTTEENVGNMFYKLLGIYVVFAVPDSIQIILHGIIKGLGKQKWASICCLVILYPFNILFAYYLGFNQGLGLIGLWYSQMTSVFLLVISYVVIFVTTDLDEVILELKQHEDSKSHVSQELREFDSENEEMKGLKA